MPSTLLANLKQLPDPQANRERPPVRLLQRGQACGLLHVGEVCEVPLRTTLDREEPAIEENERVPSTQLDSAGVR